jgi:hypothetical protein
MMSNCAKANIIIAAVILIGASLFIYDPTKIIDSLVKQNTTLQGKMNDVLAQAISENKVAAEAHKTAIKELETAKKNLEEKLKSCR